MGWATYMTSVRGEKKGDSREQARKKAERKGVVGVNTAARWRPQTQGTNRVVVLSDSAPHNQVVGIPMAPA